MFALSVVQNPDSLKIQGVIAALRIPLDILYSNDSVMPEDNRVDQPNKTTMLLKDFAKGDKAAEEKLAPHILAELRRQAAIRLRRDRAGHTLQATALVHEAWIRLVEQNHVDWKNRAHFFAIASRIMEQVLVDHARKRIAAKRGNGRGRLLIDLTLLPGSRRPGVDILELKDEIDALERLDKRQANVVRLRLFGEMSCDEVAETLNTSVRTVKADWRMARAWLAERLSK